MFKLMSANDLKEKEIPILKERCEQLKKNNVTPSLKVILVGSNNASILYTKNKKRYCEFIGAKCEIIHLEENISKEEFLNQLKISANDLKTHGCFVQLPLPEHLKSIEIENFIPHKKDIDGLGSQSFFDITKNKKNSLNPCTPKGIISLLKFYNIEIKSKNVVIVGRSHIVGKPLALLLTNEDATVTLCHSKTVNLEEHTQKADIIVSAIGKAHFITSKHIGKNSPVVIDVGINRNEKGKLCGDVDFDEVKNLCSAITPVPGGVGPMTIHSLIKNLLLATENLSKNEMKKTSLHKKHIELNAQMAPFANFEMPIRYSSIKEEVLAVRENCGVFDVSHMGEFFVEGEDAINFIDFLITNDFKNSPIQKALYSPLCKEDGSIIDDLICYKLSSTKVLICMNASNVQNCWEWFQEKFKENKKRFNCEIQNKSDSYSLLAVQGPQAESILFKNNLLPSKDQSYYSVTETLFNKKEIILARTGYTGEDGFEIFSDHETIKEIWNILLLNNVTPCGLASRDVLRLEVCYPLYGHELSLDWTPLDSGLKWTVKMDKGNFIGKDFLLNYKPKFQLIKLSIEKGIPRENYPVANAHGVTVGKVTSGTMSIVLKKGICLALIEREKFSKDEKLFIKIRNNLVEAKIHKKSFISGGHK